MDDLFETENQFKLTKTSFLTVGGLQRQCIKFLPNLKNNYAQSVIIGDARGVIYITQYKKTEPEILIRTNPYPKEIACIQVNPDPTADKIFFAVGNSLFEMNRSYTTKFKIEFDLADDIQTFQVIENNIWAVSNNYLAQYEYGEITTEKWTFDNECKIISIFVSTFLGKREPFVVLGSEDNKIKFVQNNEVFKILPTKGGVNCISLASLSLYDHSENNFLYGTTTGSFGIITFTDKDTIEIVYESEVPKDTSEVVDLKVFDINNDGLNEIILIRANGMVEIYQIGTTFSEITLIAKHSTGEHLTGIDIGKFKTNDKYEIMLISLTGLVFSLTPMINNKKAKAQNIDRKTLGRNLYEIEREVDALKQTYSQKQEELEKLQLNKEYLPTSKNSYKLDVKFTLNQKESVFALIIDSEFPLEMVVLHCAKAKLDIIELKTKDVFMNIIQESGMDEDTRSHTKFLCTFKLKEATHRLELIVRTYEGVTDIMNITVIPNNKPKTAQIVQVPIYALSFYKKHEPEFEQDLGEVVGLEDENIVNVLSIEGISPSELNQIIHLIIPNIPAQMKNESAKYVLRSTFLNSLLEISLDSNKNEIKTPHLSTLIILKEQITKEANLRKKEVRFHIKFRSFSVFKILEILNPKLEEVFNLEMKYKVVNAFKELGDSIQFNELPEEYIKILNTKDETCNNYSKRTINLNYLINLIETLLTDLKKVITVSDYQDKVNDIHRLFEDYSYDKLKNIFSFLNNI